MLTMVYISYHAVAITLFICQVIERPACACSQKQIKVQKTQFIIHVVRKTQIHELKCNCLTWKISLYANNDRFGWHITAEKWGEKKKSLLPAELFPLIWYEQHIIVMNSWCHKSVGVSYFSELHDGLNEIALGCWCFLFLVATAGCNFVLNYTDIFFNHVWLKFDIPI